MTQKTAVRQHKVGEAAPRTTLVQSPREASRRESFTALLESAAQEILAVTYWFDPVPHPTPSPITVRFSGQRVGVKGRRLPGDRFTQDETIEHVLAGSGPIALTARIRGINPGEWMVTARVVGATHPARRTSESTERADGSKRSMSAARFWRRWAPPAETGASIQTCLPLFVRVPGILPGIWGAMATLGVLLALLLQFLLMTINHLAPGPWWVVSLVALVAGISGAKGWYLFLYRREHLVNGWCIQGFITGATLSAAILLVALRMPIGIFLDVTAPGLLLAMAVGRVGCFFAGCCGGPPTASRFGVWSSDQRVGARRLPTQLLESALAAALGVGVLMAIQRHGPAGGAFFAIGLATYTLVRQGILLLRAERRKTKLGAPTTATLATFVLVAALFVLIR